jgi:hypothetical protein
MPYNGEGLPQLGLNLNWTAANWRTFFLQANLRQHQQNSKWTIPNASVVASNHVSATCIYNRHFLKYLIPKIKTKRS